ncbi:hypothetical protein [Pseudonocardia sp. DLS-67]
MRGRKSQVQALDRSAPVLPMLPADPERRTHTDIRHGTASPVAALDGASGKVYSSPHRQHLATEFRKFLAQLDREVPAELATRMLHRGVAAGETR